MNPTLPLAAASLLMSLTACTASVAINAQQGNADIYITDYAPSVDAPPSIYEAHGTGQLFCELDYYAWEEYYMWVGAPGFKPEVSKLRHEPKPLPIVVAVLGSGCVFPLGALVWAYGPDEGPYRVNLEPAAPAVTPAAPAAEERPLAIPGY